MPTLIFCDSFDHYATADILKKWSSSTFIGDQVIVAAAGRNGTAAMRLNHTQVLEKALGATYPALYLEEAVYVQNLSNGTGMLLALGDSGGNYHLELRVLSTGALQVTRNGTVLNTTSPGLITLNAWYHIGLYGLIHSTTGAYEVRYSGVSVLSATNVNTRNGGNGDVGFIRVSSTPSSQIYIDDLVASSDGFCGDCRVKALLPAGAGNYSEWSLVPTSYAFNGGQGARTSLITITQGPSAILTGTLSAFVDGSYSTGPGNTNSASITASHWIKFDFGSPRVITEATHYQNGTAAQGNWKWQGSNDDSAYTDIGTTFAWGGAATNILTTLSANVTAYRYYKLQGVSGTSTATVQYEIDFKIDNTGVLAYQCVDEASMNSDTDYVYKGIVGTDFTSDSAMQGYWYLEEAAGATRNDGSGKGNHLTSVNTVGQSSTKKQGAYSAAFNKASSRYLKRVDASLSAEFPGKSGVSTANLTAGAWVQMASTSSLIEVFAKGDHYAIYYHNGSQMFHAELADGGGYPSAYSDAFYNATLNTWIHLAMRFTGATKELALYVNGVKQATPVTAVNATIAGGAEDLAIGSAHYGTNYWDGLIDEVFVINRALSDAEILSIYTYGLNGGGRRNSYDMQPSNMTGVIRAVQHISTMRKDDAGSKTAKLFTRIGGVDYDGPAVSVTDTYLMQRRVMSTNPATSTDWTPSTVDAAEFGTRLES